MDCTMRTSTPNAVRHQASAYRPIGALTCIKPTAQFPNEKYLAGLRKTLTMLCSTEGVGYGANSLQAMTVDKGVVRIAHIDCGP